MSGESSTNRGQGSRKRKGSSFLTDREIEAQIALLHDESDVDDLDELNNGEETGWNNSVENTENPELNDSDYSDISDDEVIEDEHDQNLGPQMRRRTLLRDRLLCDLDAALDPDNYDRYFVSYFHSFFYKSNLNDNNFFFKSGKSNINYL